MDAAERIAREQADTVCLEVGLHSGYGSAQRMYVKRGYVAGRLRGLVSGPPL
jgi:hypothetical protein